MRAIEKFAIRRPRARARAPDIEARTGIRGAQDCQTPLRAPYMYPRATRVIMLGAGRSVLQPLALLGIAAAAVDIRVDPTIRLRTDFGGAAVPLGSVRDTTLLPEVNGMTAYGYPNFEHADGQAFLRATNESIDQIGFLTGPADFLPKNSTDSFGVAEMAAWFSSGGARQGFDKGDGPEWSAGGMLRKAAPVLATRNVTMWAYLSEGNGGPAGDGGFCDSSWMPASERHRCHAASGFPLPDAEGSWDWWAELLSGMVAVITKLAPPVTRVHVWNGKCAHNIVDFVVERRSSS